VNRVYPIGNSPGNTHLFVTSVEQVDQEIGQYSISKNPGGWLVEHGQDQVGHGAEEQAAPWVVDANDHVVEEDGQNDAQSGAVGAQRDWEKLADGDSECFDGPAGSAGKESEGDQTGQPGETDIPAPEGPGEQHIGRLTDQCEDEQTHQIVGEGAMLHAVSISFCDAVGEKRDADPADGAKPQLAWKEAGSNVVDQHGQDGSDADHMPLRLPGCAGTAWRWMYCQEIIICRASVWSGR